jgi:hypothetical protein
MADYIGATPQQNPILGLLAERLKQVQQFATKPFGYSNPPAEAILNLLGVPAVQQTMERMAYGEPLTTGRGMTTSIRPEVAEAAMTVAPAAGLLAKATKGLPVGMSTKAVDDIGGLLTPKNTINSAEKNAKEAIDALVNQARYFGVDSPVDHTKLPIGVVMSHLDDYLGRSQQVAELPEGAKTSLRNLFYKAEDAANAYKRVYGEDKLMGKMPDAANKEKFSTRPEWIPQELEDALKNKEITKRQYEKQVMKNFEEYFNK